MEEFFAQHARFEGDGAVEREHLADALDELQHGVGEVEVAAGERGNA